jgi:hypothetical protein
MALCTRDCKSGNLYESGVAQVMDQKGKHLEVGETKHYTVDGKKIWVPEE